VFSIGDDPRLYIEDSRPVELELREPPEMSVEDDGEEKTQCVNSGNPKHVYKSRTPKYVTIHNLNCGRASIF
jgi:hypothetical protein